MPSASCYSVIILCQYYLWSLCYVSFLLLNLVTVFSVLQHVSLLRGVREVTMWCWQKITQVSNSNLDTATSELKSPLPNQTKSSQNSQSAMCISQNVDKKQKTKIIHTLKTVNPIFSISSSAVAALRITQVEKRGPKCPQQTQWCLACQDETPNWKNNKYFNLLLSQRAKKHKLTDKCFFLPSHMSEKTDMHMKKGLELQIHCIDWENRNQIQSPPPTRH